MGHLRKVPARKDSTSSSYNCGRKQNTLERNKASIDATTLPTQEPGNIKTKHVFMTVRLADGFIVSNQTGAYPWTPSKGNKYVCIFYVYNPNFIKGIAIKSRHSSELLKAYTTVYD